MARGTGTALSRRTLLALGAAALAAGTFGYARLPPAQEGPVLDAGTAFQRAAAGDLILVDIRRPEEWQTTGIGQGAHPLDMRRPDFIAALTDLAQGDRSRPIALICAGGVRSARLARQLEQAGFTAISDVAEGMLGSSAGPGWLKRGLPVTRG